MITPEHELAIIRRLAENITLPFSRLIHVNNQEKITAILKEKGRSFSLVKSEYVNPSRLVWLRVEERVNNAN